MKKAKLILCISLLVMFISMISVSLIQTKGGHVKVKRLQWETEDGRSVCANLYIPDTASASKPAPAVVTSHGYLNNKEMQDANSVELSRRGFVVIAVDQPGCGWSDTGDYEGKNGSGYNFTAVNSAVLELSRLPYVDTSRIGVTGHSMGGMSCNWAVAADNARERPLIAAVLLNCTDAVYTKAAASQIVVLGCDGNFINLYGSRDVGMISCVYDEFFHKTQNSDGKILDSPFFMKNNPNVQSFLHFGVNPSELEERNAGTMYHETIDGKDAIRVVYRPAQIHPWSHFSKKSATATIDFFDTALGSPVRISSSHQIWQLKEAFNFLGMIGFVMFIIALTGVLVNTNAFKELRADAPVTAMKSDKKGILWFIVTSAVSTLFGIFTYQPVVAFAGSAPFAEQTMIFGIAVWAALCGLVSILMMYISYRLYGKTAGIIPSDRGITMSAKKFGKSVLLAGIVIVSAYLCVFTADYFCMTDFRIWNVGIKTFNANILRISLFPHALLFLVFYVSFSVSNNSFNFTNIGGKYSWSNNLVLTVTAVLPLILLLAYQYGTYVATGNMPIDSNNGPMNIAQLWAFLIIIPGASIIDRMIYKVTKNPYIGGIITGIIVAVISCSNTTTRLV